jgi:hypothetical protein
MDFEKARNCIDAVKDVEIRMFLKAAYLLAAQGCELAGKLDSPTGNRQKKPDKVYGPKGSDASLLTISDSKGTKISVVLFKIQSARLNTIPIRLVALPISKEVDPWAEELYNFFLSKDKEYVFQFNRQRVWYYLTRKDRVFDGLFFKTRTYNWSNKDGEELTCFAHLRLLKIHHLQILRSYELTDKFGFNSDDLALYLGSKMSPTGFGTLTNQNWHKYIHKLCKC